MEKFWLMQRNNFMTQFEYSFIRLNFIEATCEFSMLRERRSSILFNMDDAKLIDEWA